MVMHSRPQENQKFDFNAASRLVTHFFKIKR
jgi:hypothetical protein